VVDLEAIARFLALFSVCTLAAPANFILPLLCSLHIFSQVSASQAAPQKAMDVEVGGGAGGGGVRGNYL
jgi:hypothetical protein